MSNYAERKAALAAKDREWLEATIIDSEYNKFLGDRADVRENESDPHGHGKRIPYIGWYWRNVSFSEGTFPIGNCGEFIGFMENNKWGYPERRVTPDEFAAIMEIIDAARDCDSRGGSLVDIISDTDEQLARLWEYMQTLPMPDNDQEWSGSSSLPSMIRAITEAGAPPTDPEEG